MEAMYPSREIPGRRFGSVARYIVAIATTAALLVTGRPALAEPEEIDNPQASLDQLEEKADRLAEAYRGELVVLEDTKRAARRAAARAQTAKRNLRRASQAVATLAAEQYKQGSVGPALTVLMSRDPEAMLDRAATVDYLSQQKARQIARVQALRDKARAARRRARDRVADVRREVEQLEQQRQRVQRLVERYEARAAARAASSPASPDNITSRMARVRAAIMTRFGDGHGVGCYRPDDSGEHPLGRACDFMLSSGGSVPSSSQVQRGYDIAEWAVANASRLGIMYVIYRQRIWDIRCGCGWESMEDRGGVTANHIDHVHISVF